MAGVLLPLTRADIQSWRAQFPALAQEVHGKPLAYLDNAASSLRARASIDAELGFYERDGANVHRGVHTLSERGTVAFERARGQVREFVNAARSEEIVFVRGTTEAINLVAQSFVRPRLVAGDEILITGLEHHSNIVPWQLLCAATGVRLVVAPVTDTGELVVDEFAARLGSRTRFAAFGHVSNALGTVNPVADLVALAHERGVPVLVDGAQAAPHLPIDVQALGCDFYAFSGHKVFGPSGIGALYGRHEHLEAMPPWQGGGDMILSVSFEHTEYNVPPHRFEAGTPNVAGAIGLGAALAYLGSLDREAIAAHEAALLAVATAAVGEMPGIRLIGTAAAKVGVVSFVVDGVHPHDVGTILDRAGVAVRAGHHCAQPLMARLGLVGTARASFAFYNTFEEVEALAQGLRQVRELFG